MGAASAIYQQPASAFVAGFVGHANLILASVTAVSGTSVTVVDERGRELCMRALADSTHVPGDKVSLLIRPESIELSTDLGSGPTERRYDFRATVRHAHYLGGSLDVSLLCNGAVVRASASPALIDDPSFAECRDAGRELSCSVDGLDILVLPRDG